MKTFISVVKSSGLDWKMVRIKLTGLPHAPGRLVVSGGGTGGERGETPAGGPAH